ncbi:hypothetical protein ACFLT8_07110 [Chloroflexota bacterium]
MVAKYKYFLLSGLIPQYQHRLGMTISSGIFRDSDSDELKEYYRGVRAKIPATKKLIEFDGNTVLYCLKYNNDDFILIIRSTRTRDVVKAFDALKYLLALVYHTYSEELEMVPLNSKPSFSNCTSRDLFDLVKPFRLGLDMTIFTAELQSGTGITDRQILDIIKQLIKVYMEDDKRKALACLYQSQLIYYTHLVGSFVEVHSRPEFIHMSRDELVEHNLLYQEMLHCSLLTCYRGIEAIFSKNFRSEDFRRSRRRSTESYMGRRIPGAPPRSKYRLRFYRQRESTAPKNKLIITMLEILFRARNRAAHGYKWVRRYRTETFGKDLVDESKFFLGYLIISALS